MTNERITISYLGLAQADLRILETFFKLSPELAKTYELEAMDDFAGADIVLVNADNSDAVSDWHEVSAQNDLVSPVLVTSGNNSSSDLVCLTRPITLKKLITSFQAATSLESRTNAHPGLAEDNDHWILVVDDSYSVRKYMEHALPILSARPLNVDFAKSGEEAMAMMKHRNYNLVFLDVVMPGLDGYKVCKWIKSEYPSYVVMLTSKKSPFDKVRGNMSGCDSYITKPPQEDKLRIVLENNLGPQVKSQTKESTADLPHGSNVIAIN